MKQINAIGDACPLPVIKTKKALDQMAAGTLEVLVDNEIAVQNIQKYVNSVGGSFQFKQEGEYYAIVIEKQGDAAEEQAAHAEAPAPVTESAPGKTVAVLSSDAMGRGDDELGRLLMKGFVFALTQLGTLPDTVLLYNSGAKLSIQGAVTLNDLKALEQAGTTILTCGTCLGHFGITDQLAVGEVTNMYQIVEEMRSAGRILRP